MGKPEKQKDYGHAPSMNDFVDACVSEGWNDCYDAWTEYLGSEEFLSEEEIAKIIRNVPIWRIKHGDISIAEAIINHIRGKVGVYEI